MQTAVHTLSGLSLLYHAGCVWRACHLTARSADKAGCCCVLVVVQETVGTLKERACAAFGIDPAKVEIWDYFNHGKYANLENQLDKDLDAARVLDDQPILLDDKVRHAYMQLWSCKAYSI